MPAKTTARFGTVMLIDDNEIDNLINQKMLEAAGICDVIITHTGAKSALEFLKNVEKLSPKAGNDILPQLIFLDIDMPIMDGFQFLEEYDKMSETVRDYCKIIMLTSSINPQDLARSKKSRYVSKYINKPLTQESIEKITKSDF